MGVDVNAEVMVGIWFEDETGAKEFISEYFDLSEYADNEDYDMYVGELSECLEDKCGLMFKDYSGYNDHGGCLGIEVGECDIEPTGEKLNKIYSDLLATLPKEYHDKIQAHIWARYW